MTTTQARGANSDCAGGSPPDLIAIAGDAARVVAIADFMSAAAKYSVHLSRGAPGDEGGRAIGQGPTGLRGTSHGTCRAAHLVRG
ncbi:hypothetical protein G3I54_16575 [Streptomyces sp. SID14515]|nr:hypothetical protein [Streptomyces sp. SID14515]NEB38518.1 hypothetical protein [Streptomyces sp. SID14515]